MNSPLIPAQFSDKFLYNISISLPQLKSLNISNLRILDDIKFNHVTLLTKLQNLNISGHSHLTLSGLTVLNNLKSLRYLYLPSKMDINSNWNEFFNCISKLKRLHKIITCKTKKLTQIEKKNKKIISISPLFGGITPQN